MTSLQAFNSLLENFVEELQRTFPEEEGLEYFSEELKTLLKVNNRAPLTMFMNALTPHTDYIMAKNPALFDQTINLGGRLDLAKLWNTPGLSTETREALWQHIHTLFMLGTTIQYLPADMLSTIENAAKECAKRIEAGEQLDLASIASNMAGILGPNVLGGNDSSGGKKRLN